MRLKIGLVVLALLSFVTLIIAPTAIAEEGLHLGLSLKDGVKFAKVGKPYEITIAVRNDGGETAWDTYLEYYFPENAEIIDYDPKPRSFYPNRASYYLYNFDPGEELVVTITLVPKHRGTISNMVDLWYRSEREPSNWKNSVVRLDTLVKGRKEKISKK